MQWLVPGLAGKPADQLGLFFVIFTFSPCLWGFSQGASISPRRPTSKFDSEVPFTYALQPWLYLDITQWSCMWDHRCLNQLGWTLNRLYPACTFFCLPVLLSTLFVIFVTVVLISVHLFTVMDESVTSSCPSSCILYPGATPHLNQSVKMLLK